MGRYYCRDIKEGYPCPAIISQPNDWLCGSRGCQHPYESCKPKLCVDEYYVCSKVVHDECIFPSEAEEAEAKRGKIYWIKV